MKEEGRCLFTSLVQNMHPHNLPAQNSWWPITTN